MTLVEMAEYMEACALIARNVADIHNSSKELRAHADGLTAIANHLSKESDAQAEIERLREALRQIRDDEIIQGMSPSLFARLVIQEYSDERKDAQAERA